MSRGELVRSRWASAARVVQLAAALSCALLAPEVRADVAPPNLRGCEGAHEGQPCETDACTPGTCRTTPHLLCKGTPPACTECLFLGRDAGASCDEACTPTRSPCVLCFPADPARDAARHVYRWYDCSGKRMGDGCKTPACEDGTCEIAACDEPPCSDFVCTPPRPSAPSKQVVLAVTGGLVVLLGGALGAMALRRRRRR